MVLNQVFITPWFDPPFSFSLLFVLVSSLPFSIIYHTEDIFHIDAVSINFSIFSTLYYPPTVNLSSIVFL